MREPANPGARGADRIGLSVAAAVALVLVAAALLLGPLSPAGKHLTTGVSLVAGAALLAGSCGYRARRATGHRRRAWTIFTVAAGLAAVANLLAVFPNPLSPSGGQASALVLLAAVLVIVVGLITFALGGWRPVETLRLLLDGVIIGGSLLFLASVVFLPDLLDAPHSRATTVALPVADILVATFIASVVLRRPRADGPMLTLIALGFFGYAVADFAYAIQTGQTGVFQFGQVTDLGWIIGYAVIALGLRMAPPRVAGAPSAPAGNTPVLGTTLIFTLFLAATMISLFGPRTFNTAASLIWLLVILGIMARQTFLLIDNEQLRRVLVRRVAERSRSLDQVTQQSDLLVDAVGDGIYGVDRSGVLTFLNPAAARTLGVSPESLIGRSAHETFHGRGPNGEMLPTEHCYITEAIRDGVTAHAEEDTYIRSDGVLVPVEVTTTPLYDEGNTFGAVVVFRDITQRREVDQMKSEFVSMVSHELRTPLTAIRGSLGLMSGGALGELTPPAQRMVDIALVSSERLARLINDILDIERIEAGGMVMEVVDLSSESLIRSAVEQVQVVANDNRITVHIDPCPGQVRADSDRTIQTLINVVGNAIKFSSPGQIVSVGSRPVNDFVEFYVSDRGRGIPEDKLDVIFRRFEQVDSSDARDKGGSGLGLAISQSIVEQLGGRIWATNNPGGGATFRFTLPSVPCPSAAPDPLREDTVVTGDTGGTNIVGRR